ncbi:MAG: hypothetical protein J6C97_01755, partial [Clostridia bacterium]|nr:hypothetical protein [Clostridia bacterium]
MVKKYSLITALALIMLVCATLGGVFATTNKVGASSNKLAAGTRVYSGVNMSTGANAYQLDTGFTSNVKTMEAMVRLTGTKNGLGRYGVAVGGCYASENGNNYFNFEFSSIEINGVWGICPRLYWNDGEINWLVPYHLTTWSWYHVTFVRDTSANKIYCYVNGDLAGTHDGVGQEIPMPTAKHYIGRDARDGVSIGTGSSYLMGYLNYVSVSSSIMSATQVKDGFVTNKRVVDSTDSGAMYYKDFSEKAQSYFRAEQRLTATPNTFTATINLPTSQSWYSGVIMGTFSDDHGASNSRDVINLEVTTGGYVRIIWDPSKFERVTNYMNSNNLLTDPENTADVVFDTPVSGYTGALNVNTGKDTHIAVVRDRSNGCFHLYINGVLASTKAPTTAGAINALKTNIIPLHQFAIGRDLRLALAHRQAPFLGQIKDVAIYSTPLSANQITEEYNVTDKTTLNKTVYSGLMLNYVLDSNQQTLKYDDSYSKTLTDYSGNGNNAFVCTNGDYFVPEEDWLTAGEDEYTLIYVPDTQCTVRSNYTLSNIMFDWIVDNAEEMNLSFVMGLGDIIDGVPLPGDETITSEINTQQQWDVMIANYEKLTKVGINWNAIVGNHDYDDNYLGVPNGRKADIYNEHFGANLSSQKLSSIVEFYNNQEITINPGSTDEFKVKDMLNVIYEYTATTVGGTEVKYLVVALEFGVSDDVLAWASEVISRPEYVNHRVLFNSHSILFSNGEFNNAYTLANPEHYAWAWSADINLNNGSQMWDEFIQNHDNMFLTASGHIGTDFNISRQDTGKYGNKVLSTLCDGQSTKYYGDIDGVPGWGDPLIQIARVNEKTKQIKYYYFNPVNNMLFGVENQWTYDFSNALNTKQIVKDKNVNYDKEYGTIGENVEFTLNAQSGYALSKPIVKDLNGKDITVTQNGETYSFVMPNNRVSISVETLDLSNITLP